MKLTELATTNFMPYAGKMSLAFPTEADRNVMIVFGDNMRGKTSLLNAIRWALYGKAVGRHSREIELQDLVNKEATLEGDWSMEARVNFTADGHDYEMRRRATKRAWVATPTRPEDFEISSGLKKDGMVLPEHQVDAEINRFAPEQTSRFFLFDGELLQEYESLLIDGSAQGKKIKEAIEQALGVPTLIRGREDAQTLLRSAQKQQNKDIEKIAGLEKQTEKQAALQASAEAIERDIAALGDKLGEARAEMADLDEFIEKTEAVHVAKERLVALQANKEGNEQRQADLNAERLALIQDSWREVLRPMVTLKRDQLRDGYAKFADQSATKSKTEARVEELRRSVESERCSSCGQELHQPQREEAGKELGRLEADLRGMTIDTAGMQALSAELRDLDRLLLPTSAPQIASIDRDLARLSVELTSFENEIEKLADSIRGQDTAEVARKRAFRQGLSKEEGRLEQQIKDSEAALEKIRRDLAMLSRALQNTPAANQRSTKVVQIASILEAVFGRSIDQLRDDLKRRVEDLASKAFRQMTTQANYAALRINSNYGLAIIDERGDEVPVRSAGAEQIVALSLIDGLARAGRSAGPVVMDTPFGRLDPKHRANILRYLPTTTEQLVLLVHEGEINKSADIAEMGSRVASVYEIKEVNPRHSRIERVS